MHDAFDGSVACTRPPVRRAASHASSVPQRMRPARTPARSASTRSRSHSILLAAISGVIIRPCAISSRQRSWVRMSCQESAGPSGRPERASHTTAVDALRGEPEPAHAARRHAAQHRAHDRRDGGEELVEVVLDVARAPGRPAGSRGRPAPRRRPSRRAGAPARRWCRRRARGPSARSARAIAPSS